MFLLLYPSMPDHYCAVVLQNIGKAYCDNQQWAFSCFGGHCAKTNIIYVPTPVYTALS